MRRSPGPLARQQETAHKTGTVLIIKGHHEIAVMEEQGRVAGTGVVVQAAMPRIQSMTEEIATGVSTAATTGGGHPAGTVAMTAGATARGTNAGGGRRQQIAETDPTLHGMAVCIVIAAGAPARATGAAIGENG